MKSRMFPLLIGLLLITPSLSGCASPIEQNRTSLGQSTANTISPTSSSIQPTPSNLHATIQPSINDQIKQQGTPDTKLDPIKEQIRKMTINQKIGQMVIVGLEGETTDPKVEELINSYQVGGFILFKRNISSASQTVELLNNLKQINDSLNDQPLFLSVDEEGGRVSRMPNEFIKLPTNQVIGSINNETFAAQYGEQIAKQIRMLGFNMDFAPVLDINSNPNNPIIGDRSFSSKQSIVTNLGVNMMKGISKEGIIPVVKHFPGHGDTSMDSHIGLPIINRNLTQLVNFELKPFAKAVNQGAEVVMVAHLLLPELDPTYPASLSKVLIHDVLRQKLGFEGVVITDDMTMGAIETNYGIGEAVVQSVKAGTDIVLVCHSYDKQIAAIEALKKAAEAGEISSERIDDSVYRIMRLKNKYQLTDALVKQFDVKAMNEEFKQLLDKYIP